MLRADGEPQTSSLQGWTPQGTKQYNLMAARAAASRLGGARPWSKAAMLDCGHRGEPSSPMGASSVSSLSHGALYSLGGRRGHGGFPDTGVASHESYRSQKPLNTSSVI